MTSNEEKEFWENKLSEIFKPMTEEERKKEREKEKILEEVVNKRKRQFLKIARNLPGAQDEKLNDPIIKIKGEIINDKISNLRALTVTTSFREIFNMTDDSKSYFTISPDGSIEIESDVIPDELTNLISEIFSEEINLNDNEGYNNGKQK